MKTLLVLALVFGAGFVTGASEKKAAVKESLTAQPESDCEAKLGEMAAMLKEAMQIGDQLKARIEGLEKENADLKAQIAAKAVPVDERPEATLYVQDGCVLCEVWEKHLAELPFKLNLLHAPLPPGFQGYPVLNYPNKKSSTGYSYYQGSMYGFLAEYYADLAGPKPVQVTPIPNFRRRGN